MPAIKEFGSEFDWKANEAFLRPGSHQLQLDRAKKFRSGRDAMKAVAISAKDRYRRVLLPALCCESMVSPFTMQGMEPVFYRLHPDYTANIMDVERKLSEDTILVYSSYFGIHPFDENALCVLRRAFPHALFMEDRTQDILAPREGGFTPDITVASIRKWIPVPDGGLLWGEIAADAKNDNTFALLRKEAMVLKSEYLETGDPQQKEQFRHMLGDASEILDISNEPYTITEESVRLLNDLDFAKIYARRQENAKALMAALTPDPGVLQLITATPEISTLYFPILVADRNGLQGKLAQKGIYCPVIWPVPQEALGVCQVAEYTAAHMLGVPCDQRYTPKDMAHIGREIMRILYE